MKKLINLLALFGAVVLINSCTSTKKTTSDLRTLDTITVSPQPPKPYQATAKRNHDLIHTELHVSFDWQKQYLHGKAVLTLKPYFHSTNIVELDAKGMDIHKVGLKTGNDIKPLPFEYDSLVLKINLFEAFTRTDTFKLFIDYTAKPNELKQQGSAAITDAKGLYFINPLGEEENKPQQIWTQGETEASSCWFPTIDRPNEKMTQEIYITVDNKYKTLSNGELMFQDLNGDGTRTDFWKQHKPHTPYLAMMAIGDFAVVKDTWRDTVDVHYFVEHEYEKFAKDIFGQTPEMMEFFSQKMGVDYPWHKYHQVVVRDYVSGAMENTSAVIHGEFLHQTKREMIDGDNQDIIAHELFHHWFGDLVTCESWSNLPLNESFATYGEYLWREYKQGRESADKHLEGDLSSYLRESKYKQEDMIRFDYEDKEDMFDSHSYAKGGRILHMLRCYVGDDAFFESLRVYLSENAYQTAEIHNLRMAFEKVTGEDLNWFFNQWFLSSGHPKLEFKTNYNDSLKKVTISVKQLQDLTTTPLYYLPIKVDIYTTKGVDKKEIIISEKEQLITFNYNEKPRLVNIDADKMLLCEKLENKTAEEWIYQYNNAPLFIDRLEALEGLNPYLKNNEEAYITILSSLNDNNENIRKKTINVLEVVADSKKDEVEALLKKVAKEDKSSLVRTAAIKALSDYYSDIKHAKIFNEAIQDSSYNVMSAALSCLAKVEPKEAMAIADKLKNDHNKKLRNAVAEVYSQHGDSTVHYYFIKMSEKVSGYAKYSFIPAYVDYLSINVYPNVLNDALPILQNFDGGDYFNQFYSYVLMGLLESIKAEQLSVDQQLKKAETAQEKDRLVTLNTEYSDIKKQVEDIIKSFKD